MIDEINTERKTSKLIEVKMKDIVQRNKEVALNDNPNLNTVHTSNGIYENVVRTGLIDISRKNMQDAREHQTCLMFNSIVHTSNGIQEPDETFSFGLNKVDPEIALDYSIPFQSSIMDDIVRDCLENPVEDEKEYTDIPEKNTTHITKFQRVKIWIQCVIKRLKGFF